MSTPASVYDNTKTPDAEAPAAVTAPAAAPAAAAPAATTPSPAPAPAGTWDGRKAHICCGFCCDCYRAVIIVNMISVLLALFSLIVFILYATGVVYANTQIPGNVVSVSITTAIFAGVAIFIYSAGIYGALNFNLPLLCMATAYRAVDVIINFVFLNWIWAFIYLAFLYPHIILIMEIRSGIMSEANYHNIKNSMCCL